MARVTSVKLKLAYDDALTRTYTFTGVEDSVLPYIKSNVRNINISLLGGTAENFANTFVSDNGQPCKMISDARIISTEQEVIYSAN